MRRFNRSYRNGSRIFMKSLILDRYRDRKSPWKYLTKGLLEPTLRSMIERSGRNSSCLLHCKVFRVRKLSHTCCFFVFQQTANMATNHAHGSYMISQLVSPASCVISQDAEPNARNKSYPLLFFLFTLDLLVSV